MPDGGSKRKCRCRTLPLRPLRDGDDGVRALRDGARVLREDAHARLHGGGDVRALLSLPLRWPVSLFRESIPPK